MGGKWWSTVLWALFTQCCMSFDTQDLSDIVQDLPEIANDPADIVQHLTDPPTTTQKMTTTSQGSTMEHITESEEEKVPVPLDCVPGRSILIDHVRDLRDHDVFVWTMEDTPDFFYAAKWTYEQTCEEYTSYPTFFNQTKKETRESCATFYQVDTKCPRQESPKKYIAFRVSEASISLRYSEDIVDIKKIRETSALLDKLTSYTPRNWYRFRVGVEKNEGIKEMLDALRSTDRKYTVYEIGPHYCVADCRKTIGIESVQCNGYGRDVEHGTARKINVTQVIRYGMQTSNLGIPCDPRMPCTRQLYGLRHFCNNGQECAKYGYDHYGRSCSRVWKSREGTYCYVEDPIPEDWVWGWTHPAIHSKKGTYCYLGEANQT